MKRKTLTITSQDYTGDYVRTLLIAVIVACIVVISWKGAFYERLVMVMAEGPAIEATADGLQRDDPQSGRTGKEDPTQGGQAEGESENDAEPEPDRKTGVPADTAGEVDQGVESGAGGGGTGVVGSWGGDEAVAKVYAYTKSYPSGRIDDNYFALLYDACGGEYELLKTVVAVSVAETGMGSAGSWSSNFWGWFAGGDRRYDPERAEMASAICTGLKQGYPYGFANNLEAVHIYTCSDHVETWYANFMDAYSSM